MHFINTVSTNICQHRCLHRDIRKPRLSAICVLSRLALVSDPPAPHVTVNTDSVTSPLPVRYHYVTVSHLVNCRRDPEHVTIRVDQHVTLVAHLVVTIGTAGHTRQGQSGDNNVNTVGCQGLKWNIPIRTCLKATRKTLDKPRE